MDILKDEYCTDILNEVSNLAVSISYLSTAVLYYIQLNIKGSFHFIRLLYLLGKSWKIKIWE